MLFQILVDGRDLFILKLVPHVEDVLQVGHHGRGDVGTLGEVLP